MSAHTLLSLLENCANLGEMLERAAGRHPERTAILTEEARIKYRELNAEANRIAHALERKLGLRPSDRVAVLLGNGKHYVYTCFGVLKAAGVLVPLNTFLTAPELKYILSDSGSSVLVTSDQFAPVVRKFSGELAALRALVTVGREDLGGDTWLYEEFVAGMPDRDQPPKAARDDLSVIIYTSGTTGKPKGAMLTHGNLLSNILASGISIEIGPRDRVLVVLPMFHSFALTTCILMPAAVAAGMVVVEKLRSMQHLLMCLIRGRVTIFIGIPHIYDMISHAHLPWWVRPFMRLRVCVSGSAPLSAATLRRFEERMRVPLLEGYGLSEASPVVSINPLRGVRKDGSVGRPIPGVSVKIVSGDGRELPPGEIGEIAVRGPNVMAAYLNRPRETKETMLGGWLLTGDIGRIDEDGYIYICDRKKDMILFHGMNVYPREIEEVLYSHPAVAEAAVVGAPDRHRGEIPVAYVSFKEGESVQTDELVDFCKGSLAAYKIPHRFTVLSRLPRTSTGKILKRELKMSAAGEKASLTDIS